MLIALQAHSAVCLVLDKYSKNDCDWNFRFCSRPRKIKCCICILGQNFALNPNFRSILSSRCRKMVKNTIFGPKTGQNMSSEFSRFPKFKKLFLKNELFLRDPHKISETVVSHSVEKCSKPFRFSQNPRCLKIGFLLTVGLFWPKIWNPHKIYIECINHIVFFPILKQKLAKI